VVVVVPPDDGSLVVVPLLVTVAAVEVFAVPPPPPPHAANITMLVSTAAAETMFFMRFISCGVVVGSCESSAGAPTQDWTKAKVAVDIHGILMRSCEGSKAQWREPPTPMAMTECGQLVRWDENQGGNKCSHNKKRV
jgi:hypothetical protein